MSRLLIGSAAMSRPMRLSQIGLHRLHRRVDQAMEEGLLRFVRVFNAIAACVLVAGSAWLLMKTRDDRAVENTTPAAPPWVDVADVSDSPSGAYSTPAAAWYLADDTSRDGRSAVIGGFGGVNMGNRKIILIFAMAVLSLSAGMVVGWVWTPLQRCKPAPAGTAVRPRPWFDQLGLSSDQQKQMDKIWGDTRAQMQKLFDHRRELEKQRDQQIAELLSPERACRVRQDQPGFSRASGKKRTKSGMHCWPMPTPAAGRSG